MRYCCYLLATSYLSRFDGLPVWSLNRFDGLPALKHMVLLGHEIQQHTPTITKPSYNLEGKQHKRYNFIFILNLNVKSRFIFSTGSFTVIVYHKYLFQIFFKLGSVTCDRCPNLITNKYNVDEDM